MSAPSSDLNSVCPRCGMALTPDEGSGGCPRCLSSLLFSPQTEPPPVTDDPPILRRLGDYELLEEIARGGMGIVFRARQVSLNRIVAVKLMRDSSLARASDVERFHAEAASAAKLKHPNIVAIHDVGEQAGQHFFAMELVEGANLAERTREGPLPVREAAELLATISQAVQQAHAQGVLHRDLKPSNILIDLTGEPFVTDFGLARPLDAGGSLTFTGQLLGTPAYMAPEQARGIAVGPSADIYSLGAVLFHLLTGRAPFVGGSVADVLHQVVNSEPLAPQLLNPSVPLDLATICLKCLEKEPRHRYPSAAALAEDLRRWLQGEPISARPSPPWERALKWARRKPVVAGLVAAIVAVTMAGAAGMGWQWQAAVAARKIAEERAVAESRANRQAADSLSRLEVQRAEELFRADQAAPALAHLVRVLRENPTNSLVAQRIIDALTQRSFAIPVASILPPGNYVTKFSPDSRWIATSSPQGIQFIDAQTGRAIGPSIPHPAPSRNGGQIEFSPDSRWAAVSLTFHTQLFDLRGSTPSGSVLTHTNEVRLAVFSPESRQLLTVCGRTAHLWDCASGTNLAPQMELDNSHGSAVFSPDGQWIVTLGSNNGPAHLRIWNVQNGVRKPKIIPFTSSLLRSLGFTPDGNKLRLWSDTGVQLLDYRTATLTPSRLGETDGETSAFRLIAASPNGENLLIGSPTALKIWRVSSGRLVDVPPFRPMDAYSARFSTDGLRLLIRTSMGTFQIWDTMSGRLLGEISNPQGYTAALFNNNGGWVITSPEKNTVRLWDGHSGTAVTEAIRCDGSVHSFELSPDSRRLLVRLQPTETQGSATQQLVLWDIRRGSPLVEVQRPPSSWRDEPTRAGRASTPTQPAFHNTPVPRWLPDLAEAVAGQRFNLEDALESVPWSTRLNLPQRLAGTGDDSLYHRWIDWYFADPTVRPVSPFSPLTTPEYIRECIQQDSRENYMRALRVAPTSGILLAHLAYCILNQNPTGDPQYEGDADSYSGLAVHYSPQEPLAWSVRAEVLLTAGRLADAQETLERGVGQLPENPELWDKLGALHEQQGRVDQAADCYSKAVDFSARAPGYPPAQRAQYLAHRSDLRRQQGRVEEAAADFQAAAATGASSGRADWPAWGGADSGRNMYSPAGDLPSDFDPGRMYPNSEDVDPATTRNVKWVAKLGSQSYGNPTVADGKVYVGTNNESPRHTKHWGDRSILLCLDEQKGDLLWQLVVPKLKAGKVNDWESLGLLSSPAVEGNRVYLASTRGEALCLTTEGFAWRNVGPFTNEARYSAGPDTPAAPAGRRDADIIWRYSMLDELPSFPHNGTFTSPLIIGDLVYLNTCNGMDWTHVNIPYPLSPSLIAVNKWTGELAGEDNAGISQRIFHSQWGSPSAGVVQGRTLVFHGGGDGFCYAFDAQPVAVDEKRILKQVWSVDCNRPEYRFRKGKPLRYPAAEGPSEIIATPVFARNSLYVAIGQDPEHGEGVGNLVCLDPAPEIPNGQSRIRWSYNGIKRSISTPSITPEGLLFIGDFSGFIHCLNADTGEVHWVYDMRAHLWGSTMVADGKVYVGDEDGDFVILAASREKRVLSQRTVDGKLEDGPNLGAPIFSTPVVANGVLYVASNTHLYAIQEAPPRIPPP